MTDGVDTEAKNNNQPVIVAVEARDGKAIIRRKKDVSDWKKKPIYAYDGDSEVQLTCKQKLYIVAGFLFSLLTMMVLLWLSWWFAYWYVDRRASMGKEPLPTPQDGN